MTSLERIKLRAIDVDVLLTSLEKILSFCIQENLECVDPPIATTHFLRSLGYTEYTIRRLWSRIGEGVEVEILRSKRSLFALLLEQQKGIAYHDLETGTPLDEIDCGKLRHRCVKTSNANKAYLFIVGGVEDNRVRVNIVRVLYLLEKTTGAAFELIEAVRSLAWNREGATSRLYSIIRKLLVMEAPLLAVIEPNIDEVIESLLEHSPLLRRILQGKREA